MSSRHTRKRAPIDTSVAAVLHTPTYNDATPAHQRAKKARRESATRREKDVREEERKHTPARSPFVRMVDSHRSIGSTSSSNVLNHARLHGTREHTHQREEEKREGTREQEDVDEQWEKLARVDASLMYDDDVAHQVVSHDAKVDISKLDTFIAEALSRARRTGRAAGTPFNDEQERILVAELQRDLAREAEEEEEEAAQQPSSRETTRLSQVLRALRSLPAYRHCVIEAHSTRRRSIFPDPSVKETGVLVRMNPHVRELVHRIWMHLETDEAITEGKKNIVHLSLYIEDPEDDPSSLKPRLLPIYSKRLGYDVGHLVHKNVTALKAHLRAIDLILGDEESQEEMDFEFYESASEESESVGFNDGFREEAEEASVDASVKSAFIESVANDSNAMEICSTVY